MMVQAYVLFKVNSGSEREACEQIASLKEVLTASVIYGEYDVIAKVSVQDLQSLEKLMAEKVRKIPIILLTSTMIVAREYRGKAQRNKK